MKSKDLQKLILSNYEAGQTPKKVFQDLNGAVTYRTVKRWCKMIRETGAIDLLKPSACHRTVHTKAVVQKIKRKAKNGKRISCRKLAFEMDMSFSSAYRILRKDLKMKPYKKTVEPLLKDEHKVQRKKFANWGRKKFRRKDKLRIFFSDEKIFDLDGICNGQNDRIWVVNWEEADRRGGKKQQGKIAEKVMVWLVVCSEGVAPLVLLEKGTLNHHRYIKKVLPVALRYGNSKFGNNCTFQQDNGTPHTHQETQEWCSHHLPSFIDKDIWPANSPD